jgi:hypothetical protein
MSDRVLRVGDLALRATNDDRAIYRTVTVFDISNPGERQVDPELSGTFVASYYIANLVARESSEDRDNDLTLYGGRHKIPAQDFRAVVYPWLKEMGR